MNTSGFRKSHLCSDQRGGALLTIMMVVLIVGFLAAAMSQYLGVKIKEQKLEKLKDQRALLLNRVEAELSNEEAIRNSIARARSSGVERFFNRCTRPAGACTATFRDNVGTQGFQEFRLFSSDTTPRLIAGTSTDAAYYTVRGEPCTAAQFNSAADIQCAYMAKAYFAAECAAPPGAARPNSCAQAENLRTKIRLCTQRTNCGLTAETAGLGKYLTKSDAQGGLRLANEPKSSVFRAGDGKLKSLQSVLDDQNCDKYDMVASVGYDSNGKIICRCSWDCTATIRVNPPDRQCPGFPSRTAYNNALGTINYDSAGHPTNCQPIIEAFANECLPGSNRYVVGRNADGSVKCENFNQAHDTFNITDNNPAQIGRCQTPVTPTTLNRVYGLFLGDCKEVGAVVKCDSNLGRCTRRVN